MRIAYYARVARNKTHTTNRLMFQIVGGSLKFNSCQNFGCWQLKSAYMYIIHVFYTRRSNTKRGTNYLNRNLNTTVRSKSVDGGGIKTEYNTSIILHVYDPTRRRSKPLLYAIHIVIILYYFNYYYYIWARMTRNSVPKRAYIIVQVVIAPCDSRFTVVVVYIIKVSRYVRKITLELITARTRLDELKN
jgi:hypothetical protein